MTETQSQAISDEEQEAHYNPLRHLSLEHLRAAGVPDPEMELLNIYASLMPKKEDYDAEVEEFRADFYSAMEVKEYLEYIEKQADGDAGVYADLYDQGLTAEGRRSDPEFAKRQSLKPRQEYNPASFEQFIARQDLLPEYYHERAYALSFARADQVLTDRLEESERNVFVSSSFGV